MKKSSMLSSIFIISMLSVTPSSWSIPNTESSMMKIHPAAAVGVHYDSPLLLEVKMEDSCYFYNASYQTIGRYESSSGCFYNSYGEMTGKLADDGTIYNAGYSVAGSYRSGTFYNSSYQSIGKLDSDGTVRDGSYQILGYIRDGRVMDASYSSIGSSQANAAATAIFFFFGYF